LQKDKVTLSSYWNGFDYIKGILVIMVFLGHIIPGDVRGNLSRYVIYSFHMPMFIGISGFLLDVEKLLSTAFFDNLKKYWIRPVRPWVIAIICFLCTRCFIGETKFSLGILLKEFIFPYYHLWYIFAFISWLMIISILWKVFTRNNNTNYMHIYIISIVVGLISKYNTLSYISDNGLLMETNVFEQQSMRLWFFPFFVLGVLLRNFCKYNKNIFTNRIVIFCRIIAIVSLVMTLVLFNLDYPNVEKINFYIMNNSLLVMIIDACTKNKLPQNKYLEFMGKYSLPIYLYHIFCIYIAKILFTQGSLGYYFVCCISFLAGCIGIYYLRKIKFINYYIFGATSK